MGSHKSKEDDVSKISTSIFITNFPVTFSARIYEDMGQVEWGQLVCSGGEGNKRLWLRNVIIPQLCLKTCFEERSQNYNKPEELSTGQKENHSKDPFNIYELLNKKKDNVESEDKSKHSPQYPPGYTPKGWYRNHFAIIGVRNSRKNVARILLGGEVIIMGDFNEVRCKSEIFGSNFNVQGANVFNSFIVNTGLEEIPLAPVDESNADCVHVKILKYLKQKIRDWNKEELMFKWVWRFFTRKNTLYGRAVIKADPWRKMGKWGKQCESAFPVVLDRHVHEINVLKNQGHIGLKIISRIYALEDMVGIETGQYEALFGSGPRLNLVLCQFVGNESLEELGLIFCLLLLEM
ncbi:hypothetical protein Tco_0455834 [Tanacetum coccineum]